VLDWLFEGLWEVYAVLGMMALVLLIVWWRDRRRGWVYGLGVVVGLALAYLLLDLAVETDGEQIHRQLDEISQGVRKHDLSGTFAHLANDFTFEGKTKGDLQTRSALFFREGALQDLQIWKYRFVGKTTDPPIANVTFRVKPIGNLGGGGENHLFFDCEAQFVQDANKVWRLKTFRLFDPAHDNAPVRPGDFGVPW
jgi:hypothetical protein